MQIQLYLHLFDVEPLAHQELDNQPVDMWKCVDKMGIPVVYYFNHAPIYEWAFAQGAAFLSPKAVQTDRQKKAILPFSGGKAKGIIKKRGPEQQPAPMEKPSKIWESKLFK